MTVTTYELFSVGTELVVQETTRMGSRSKRVWVRTLPP